MNKKNKNAKLDEGYFTNGLKDGFFIEYYGYDLDGNSKKIEFIKNFSKGILNEWSHYGRSGKLIAKEMVILPIVIMNI